MATIKRFKRYRLTQVRTLLRKDITAPPQSTQRCVGQDGSPRTGLLFPRDGTLTGSQRLVKEPARSLSEPVRYGRLTRSRHPQPAGTMGDALDRGREAAERGSSASDDRLILLREVAKCAPAWQHSGHSRHSNAFGSGTSGQNNLASARLLPARRGYNLAVGSDTGNSTSRNKHGRKTELNCRHARFPNCR